jgi:mRNA interferase MazF
MPQYSFGDVVVLPFSYTDLQSEKRRPALVLLDADDGDIVAARITSKNNNSSYDIAIESWNEIGLLVLPSYIRLHKLSTIEKSHILKKIGNLTVADQIHVKEIFRKML